MKAKKTGWWAAAAVLAVLIAVLCVAQAPQVPQVPQVPAVPPVPPAPQVPGVPKGYSPQAKLPGEEPVEVVFSLHGTQKPRCKLKGGGDLSFELEGSAKLYQQPSLVDQYDFRTSGMRMSGGKAIQGSWKGTGTLRRGNYTCEGDGYTNKKTGKFVPISGYGGGHKYISPITSPIEAHLLVGLGPPALRVQTLAAGGARYTCETLDDEGRPQRGVCGAGGFGVGPAKADVTRASPPLSLTDADFQNGFEKTYSLTGGEGMTDGSIASGTLTLRYKPQALEVVVRPSPPLDQWLPQGGPDEKTAGNEITFFAKLQTKDGMPPGTVATKFRFELVDVSAEPGVCLNWPIQGATQDKDLKFKATPEVTINDPATGQEAESKKGGTEASVTVSSFDWGASGKLKVTAILAGGRQVEGYVVGRKDVKEIPIPKRVDPSSSKTADYWKETKGVSGKKDEDDDEKQSGNKHDGDGFTLFEEYRGVMAKGKHQFLDPKKKDLIVENQVGPGVAGGFGLFEKASGAASGIRVVELKQGELGQQRLVNANHKTAHGGDQYGLRLIQGTLAGDTMAKALPDATKKSPKECTEIKVDIGKISKFGASAAGWAVAHELAHGVAVQHHGLFKPQYAPTLHSGSPARVFGADGVEIAKRPYDLEYPKGKGQGQDPARVGLPGNDASGDVNCIMTYNNDYQWVYIGGTNSFHAMSPIPDGAMFCTSRTGTGRNAPGQKLPGFGDADAGNCLGQMQVKDWP